MSDDYSMRRGEAGGPHRGFQNFIEEGRPFTSTVFEATKSASTRGHDYMAYIKLYGKASGNLKNNYFSTRVVSLWNKLDK